MRGPTTWSSSWLSWKFPGNPDLRSTHWNQDDSVEPTGLDSSSGTFDGTWGCSSGLLSFSESLQGVAWLECHAWGLAIKAMSPPLDELAVQEEPPP